MPELRRPAAAIKCARFDSAGIGNPKFPSLQQNPTPEHGAVKATKATPSPQDGDTLVCAIALTQCAEHTLVFSHGSFTQKCYFSEDFDMIYTAKDSLSPDSTAYTRFFRRIDELGLTIAYYKVKLEDMTGFSELDGSDCAIDLGGGESSKSGIRFRVEDSYGFENCDTFSYEDMDKMVDGAVSGEFTVTP